MTARIVPYVPPGQKRPEPRQKAPVRRRRRRRRPVSRGGPAPRRRPVTRRRRVRKKISPAQAAFRTLAMSFGAAVLAAVLVGMGTFIFLIATEAPPLRTATLASVPSPDSPLPAKLPEDRTAYTGDPLDHAGMSVVPAALSKQDTTFGQRLCTEVSIVNTSPTPKNLSEWSWQLQTPAGNERHSALATNYDELGSGELPPGGQVSGDVCFVDETTTPAAPSEGWVILLDTDATPGVHMAWLNRPAPPA